MTVTRIFDILDNYKENFISKKTALAKKENGRWIEYSAKEYIETVNCLSSGLIESGIKKGDKVATIINNSPEWNFIDMALLQTGAIQIPVYSTISSSDYKYIFTDAEIKLIFVSDEEIYRKIRQILDEINVNAEIFSVCNINGVKNWTEILNTGREHLNKSVIEEIKKNISPHDVATILYTSGTTGYPKGVMLSHNNIVSNFKATASISGIDHTYRALSFLPLCHVYERVLNYVFQYLGVSIHYAESMDTIAENLKEVRPHVFSAVPRVIEKFYDRIIAKGRELKWLKRILFFQAVKLAERYELNGINGWWYELKLKLADKLIFSKWRQALGNNINIIASGGAALQPRLARIFWAAGIPVFEGYGLTEMSPIIAVSRPVNRDLKFGTVGPVLPGVEVKINTDGEILCKGPNIMLGYYKNEGLTKQVIDKDGWFYTGDMGEFDGKYLRITDRKKEIFKTSGGKYIAPQLIENRFKESPFIDNIMVTGENKNFPAALIVPNFAHLKSWCGIKDIPYTTNDKMIDSEKIINRIQREVDKYNQLLGKTEQVKKFVLIHDEWSVSTEELSPTLKLKRKFLKEKYRDVIEKIYA